jgi:hypothetical protein
MSHQLNDMHHLVFLNFGVDVLNNVVPGFLNFLNKVVIIWNLHGHLSVKLEEIVNGHFSHSLEAFAVLLLASLNLFSCEFSFILLIKDSPGLVNHISLSLAHFIVAERIDELVVAHISISINIIEFVKSLKINLLWEKTKGN